MYGNVDLAIDYEAFIARNRDDMLADPEKHLLFFPEDDVEVFTVRRAHRTTEAPVPTEALVPAEAAERILERTTDSLVAELAQDFIADWHSIK